MRHLTPQQVAAFRRLVWNYYRKHSRSFPWRGTRDPYRIWISEIMLQQTQTDRVRNFYTKFLCAFPNVKALAAAPLRDVLAVWQGLGYNRRALALHRAAKMIVSAYHGKLPQREEELRTIPGVDPYTAAAICAFAYNNPLFLLKPISARFLFTTFFRKRDA